MFPGYSFLGYLLLVIGAIGFVLLKSPAILFPKMTQHQLEVLYAAGLYVLGFVAICILGGVAILRANGISID